MNRYKYLNGLRRPVKVGDRVSVIEGEDIRHISEPGVIDVLLDKEVCKVRWSNGISGHFRLNSLRRV